MSAPKDEWPEERHRRNPAGVLGLAVLLCAAGTWGTALLVRWASEVMRPTVLTAVSLADALRVWGWLLQLLGLLIAAFAIAGKMDVFQHPKLGERAADLWGAAQRVWRRLTRRGVTHERTVASGGGIASVMATATAGGYAPPVRDAPISERVEWLERQVENLHRELGDVQRDVRDETWARGEAVRREREEREQAAAALRGRVDAINDRLARLFGRGLGWEATGVLLFAVGITLGTVPDVVAGLVS